MNSGRYLTRNRVLIIDVKRFRLSYMHNSSSSKCVNIKRNDQAKENKL